MKSQELTHIVDKLRRVRAEWDFAKCPRARERYCWAYEFAREVPSINVSLDDDLRELASGNDTHKAFDRHGNWHHEIQIFDSQGELDDVIALEIPPGFPEQPYLEVQHTPLPSDFKGFNFPKVRDAQKMEFADERLKQPENFAHLHIMWTAPDKALVASFRDWLKTHRPRAPITRRGKSSARLFMADLRALGAWRIQTKLRVTADVALRATGEVCGQPLFAKLPDWYAAKRRAEKTISQFR